MASFRSAESQSGPYSLRIAVSTFQGRVLACSTDVPYGYLQATEFGVPQIRERAFLVSFREGQAFKPPNR